MKISLNKIKTAYLRSTKFAQTTSNTGVVELTNAVNKISNDFYSEIQKLERKDDNSLIYQFLQDKLEELGFNGYEFIAKS